MTFQSPQWGSNSKVKVYGCLQDDSFEFQSPQWGSNSKVVAAEEARQEKAFQSPQWGSNSKASTLM